VAPAVDRTCLVVVVVADVVVVVAAVVVAAVVVVVGRFAESLGHLDEAALSLFHPHSFVKNTHRLKSHLK